MNQFKILIFFLLAFAIPLAYGSSPVAKWQPAKAERKQIEVTYPQASAHFEEAYQLLFASPPGLKAVFIDSPEEMLPFLSIWKDGKEVQHVPFSNTLRVVSLRKILAVSFRDANGDGLIDIAILGRFKSETASAKNAPEFNTGQVFTQSKSGKFIQDEEATRTDVNTMADYLNYLKINSSTTQTKKGADQVPDRLSDLALRSGMDYRSAKATLAKSGWKVSVSDEEKNSKDTFPEISCGSGSMAVCTVVFTKGELAVCISVKSARTCKDGYCIESLGGCG